MTKIESWTPPFFGVRYPVMDEGYVEGLPDELMLILMDTEGNWRLCLLLDGPDEPETVVLTNPRLADLLEVAEKLLAFPRFLLPTLDSKEREAGIQHTVSEHGGRRRPKSQDELRALIEPLKKKTQGPMATAAALRPKDFDSLTPEEKWAIDKRLGILDWDGSPET